MHCKHKDQSEVAVVCLMSPPANGRRAFTYICLQHICRAQCADFKTSLLCISLFRFALSLSGVPLSNLVKIARKIEIRKEIHYPINYLSIISHCEAATSAARCYQCSHYQLTPPLLSINTLSMQRNSRNTTLAGPRWVARGPGTGEIVRYLHSI